jgi:two-component system LytT family response regulator
MSRLRTLIVDDEPLARQRLRRMLSKETEVEIVGECADGKSALRAIEENDPDLLLLDIQMPGVDGFGVVEHLEPGSLPVVVFVTAFDEHAIHAFEACALDYLLKPVTAARLAKAIERVRKYISAVRAEASVAETTTESPATATFLVRSGQRTSLISADEIDWIEADGNYAILHAGGKNHLLRATMSGLESDLPDNFLRASRFSIVNLCQVKELQSIGGNHFAIMSDGTKTPVTRSIREVEERWRSILGTC